MGKTYRNPKSRFDDDFSYSPRKNHKKKKAKNAKQFRTSRDKDYKEGFGYEGWENVDASHQAALMYVSDD